MPHDRLKLDPTPDLAVMTRVLRLPTGSTRQARKIVKLQLDRLSPIPAGEALWDLILLRLDGAEGVFALGLIRKSELNPDEPQRSARRPVDDQEVVFQFRNGQAASFQEAKLISRAPGWVLTALCAAALSLSIAAKADEWRDLRLSEIARDMRDQRKFVRDHEAEEQARKAWTAVSETDAALQWLCLATRLRQDQAAPTAVASLETTPNGTVLITRDATALPRLQALGAEFAPSSDGTTRVTISPEVCR